MLKSILFYTGVLLLLLLCSCSNEKNKTRLREKQISPADTITEAAIDSLVTPDFNIYIENSASMDGYVATESDFKNTVYSFITDIKARNLVNELNLHYINDSVCTFKPNAVPDDISYFIRNLNPATFKNNGCERKTSYLPHILKQVIAVKDDAVNVLVSDCIFSRGNGSSASFLMQQKNTIELAFSEELKRNKFSAIILKMNSQFNGRYFVESQAHTSFDLKNRNIRRPYYILIFSKQKNLMNLLSRIDVKDYKGFENSCYFFTPSEDPAVAKIVMKNKVGDFTIEHPATKLVINDAKPGNEKEFRFAFVADMNFLKVDDTFITDTANYELPPNYAIQKIENIKNLEGTSMKGHTHLYTLKTKDLKPQQTVSLKMRSAIPEWIDQSTTLDDADPFNSEQQHQTFGLEYLVNGISEGYNDVYGELKLYDVNIRVNRSGAASGNKSSAGGWWILVVAVIAGMGIIIWQKNKN